MTPSQGLAFAIVAAMMALFIWGRLRYDVVAMVALFAAVAVGIVPTSEAFSGFSDDIVIIVATALVVSAGVAKSGVAEQVMRPIVPYLKTTRAQVFALVLAVIILSTFIKNIGALAIMMPVAIQLARRFGGAPSQLLMPLAFGSLIGGLITLVGTSPNVIVARMREEILGRPFEMFDYAPVGIGIALAGLICLTLTYWLLPSGRKGGASLDEAIKIENYVAELVVPAESPLIGEDARAVERLGDGQVTLTTVVRERFRRLKPTGALRIQPGDVLLLEGDPTMLDRVVADGQLELAGKGKDAPDAETDEEEIGVVEGVITGDSPLIGDTPALMRLRDRFQVNLLAISRSGERITRRLRSVRLQAGDVLVLQGHRDVLPDALKDLGVLPLAERDLGLGRGRRRLVPVAIH